MGLGGSARVNPRGIDTKLLAVGGGTPIYKIRKVDVTVDPASIATLSTGSTAVAVPGVAAGDLVYPIPPAALEDDLICKGARVTANDQVTFYLYNASAGSVDGASLVWTCLIIEFS